MSILKKEKGKGLIRSLKYNFPGYEQIKYLKLKFRQRKFKSTEDIFTHHYEKNFWGDEESVSGSGSTQKYTENIRDELPKLINKLQVDALLDAPCGDHNWFDLIKWEGQLQYIGGDIVKTLVEANKEKFGSDTVQFMHLDIIKDSLPETDIWLCRDCFIHLSNEDVIAALDNFFKSGIKYILVSNYPDCTKNRNMPTGSGRLYNLMLPPFNFPPPIETIDDWIEGFPVRDLSLWRKDELYSAIRK